MSQRPALLGKTAELAPNAHTILLFTVYCASSRARADLDPSVDVSQNRICLNLTPRIVTTQNGAACHQDANSNSRRAQMVDFSVIVKARHLIRLRG
jgi:hypothetical protein